MECKIVWAVLSLQHSSNAREERLINNATRLPTDDRRIGIIREMLPDVAHKLLHLMIFKRILRIVFGTWLGIDVNLGPDSRKRSMNNHHRQICCPLEKENARNLVGWLDKRQGRRGRQGQCAARPRVISLPCPRREVL